MSKFKEKEIMINAINLIQEFGQLTTSELIAVLRNKMKPDGHDTEIIKNRNDDYFSQKVRNLISHKGTKNNIFLYVDEEKKGKTTLLKSRSFDKLLKKTSGQDIAQLIKDKKKKARKYVARQIKFDEINKENKLLGNEGENYVLSLEIENAQKLHDDLSGSIQHTSKELGDGAGYDILSINQNKELRFLEVKTTKGNWKKPFYMSINEYEFFLENKENYELVRVFNFNMRTKSGKIKYFKGCEIEKKFEFVVNQYKVIL